MRAPYLGWLWLVLLAAGQPAQAQDTLRYTNWRLAQADEFDVPSDSAALAARWRFSYPWGRSPGGLETEYYTGQEVNVREGSLRLTAHKLAEPRLYPAGSEVRKLRYTSGMLYGRHTAPDSLRPAPCGPGEGITYGLFEIRCRQPYDVGSFPAFWLFGNPDEVDIFEGGGSLISNNVVLYAHDYWRPGPLEEASCQCFFFWPKATRFAHGYHRYALSWLPGELIFYFDGVPIRRETRFKPMGCAMAVIANLAMWAWAGPATDALDIDYIRIYHPRQLPAQPFGAETAQPLRGGIFRFPKATAPAASNPAGEQRWQLGRAASGQISLFLRDNYNPTCMANGPLPLAPEWRGPWTIGRQATPIVVTNTDTIAARWTVLDAQGHPCRTGHWPPGRWPVTVASLGGLAPGAYRVRCQLGGAVRYQALYVLDQPADSGPTAAWLAPAATP
jgi:hypothetical protein